MYDLLHHRPLVNQLRAVRVEETVGNDPTYVDRYAVSWLRGHFLGEDWSWQSIDDQDA